jgi:DHA2 family multidrug resistance protein-like MFS transporter
MMVPVGRLTVMKIVPRDQYMAAMTFVTLPGQVGPLLGPALGGVLVEYASWHWIFLINIPVGIVGAIATLCLMPNYTMQTRRFDLSGFLLLAAGMATLTLALDGQKGLGISPLAGGAGGRRPRALLLYLWHARGNARALFSLNLFRNRTFSLGLGGSFAGRIGSGMLPFMTPVFLQIGLGFPLSRRADDDPDGARQHGHEADRGPGGQPLWLPSGAGRQHPGPGGGQPAVYV